MKEELNEKRENGVMESILLIVIASTWRFRGNGDCLSFVASLLVNFHTNRPTLSQPSVYFLVELRAFDHTACACGRKPPDHDLVVNIREE
jgi:hypothetical protein